MEKHVYSLHRQFDTNDSRSGTRKS